MLGRFVRYKFFRSFYVDIVKFLKKWNIVASNRRKKHDLYYIKNFFYEEHKILINHHARVWKYGRKLDGLNNQVFWGSISSNIVRKLITLNTKCGFKLKAYKLWGGVLNYIYTYFLNVDDELNKNYTAYTKFLEFSQDFPEEFYKPDFFFRYIYSYVELIFLIKRIKPKKKIKKKKIKTKMLVSYLPGPNRKNITLRLINSYLNSSINRTNLFRLGDSLLYLILEGKNSFLYKKKLSMYEKILEKKKFY